MNYRFGKHFTIAEARALLPQLRQLFHELHARRDRARAVEEKLGKSLNQSGGDLGGKLVASLLSELGALQAQARHLEEHGVVIKDFDRGLVDFPCLHEGREVFLCWEVEEDDIEFFHDIDAGYAGRERL